MKTPTITRPAAETSTVILTNHYHPEGMPEDEAAPAAYAVSHFGHWYAATVAMEYRETKTYLLTDRTFSLGDKVRLAADLLQDAQDIEATADSFKAVLELEIHDVSKMTAAEIVSHSKTLIEQNSPAHTEVVLWPVKRLLGLSPGEACATLSNAAFGYPSQGA